MKIEKINTYYKKEMIIGLLLISGIILALVFSTSKAKYKTTKSILLAKGTIVASSDYDFNIISMYIKDDTCTQNCKRLPDGTIYRELSSSESMPSKEEGYTINEENSYCYIGTNMNNVDIEAKVKTNSSGEHVISGLQKGSKCILYFE